MRKKKRAFVLTEVLVAIALACIASFFLLDFEGKLVTQNRKRSQLLQQECALQEATVRFYEDLYTNRIAWKSIEDKGSHAIELTSPDWKAECRFTPKKHPSRYSSDLLHATVEIILFCADIEKIKTKFDFLAKREEKLSVETAPT